MIEARARKRSLPHVVRARAVARLAVLLTRQPRGRARMLDELIEDTLSIIALAADLETQRGDPHTLLARINRALDHYGAVAVVHHQRGHGPALHIELIGAAAGLDARGEYRIFS